MLDFSLYIMSNNLQFAPFAQLELLHCAASTNLVLSQKPFGI